MLEENASGPVRRLHSSAPGREGADLARVAPNSPAAAGSPWSDFFVESASKRGASSLRAEFYLNFVQDGEDRN